MNYMSNEDGVIPALPDIRDLLSEEFREHIFCVLSNIPNETFDESVCVQRDISRVPLKLDPITLRRNLSPGIKRWPQTLRMF